MFSHSEEIDLHQSGARTLPKLKNSTGLSYKNPSNNLLNQQQVDSFLEKHHSTLGLEKNHNNNIVDDNPIPLPPRDRSKSLQPKSNLPRHQRKHPLIIPGGGVTRTLAKMVASSHEDQVDGQGLNFDENEITGASISDNATNRGSFEITTNR